MAHVLDDQQTQGLECLIPLLPRVTSPTTGLSYIYGGKLSTDVRKLFICFHGWACAATDFAFLLSTLAGLDASSSKRSLYVAVDLPGHGGSPRSLCPNPSVAGFAAIANRLRRELSPPGELLDTVLVGHSMGCRMALETFFQEKVNVTGTVVIDGSWVNRDPGIQAMPLGDWETQIRRISDRIGSYGPLTPESFKEEMARRLRDIDLEYEYELSNKFIQWDRECMEVALGEVGVAESSAKMLAIQSTQGRGANRRALKSGEEGPWLPFVKGKVGSENTQSVVIEGCGHWPHIDKVEEVARIISAFTRD